MGLKEEGDQDGRVRWYRDHLPLKMHQKYIYIAENNLETGKERLFCNQGCKEKCTGVGRKVGTHMRLGPGPLAGDTEEEWNITHRLRDPPWEDNYPSLV